MIVCDSYSKWLHVAYMNQTKAANVCNVLASVFAWWGTLPQMIVSDNGPPFESNEYMQFLTRYNIVVKHSPIYHAESNGFAERSVQIVKKAFKKVLDTKQVHDALSISRVINEFLLPYHNTPSTVTLKSPMEMLLSFKTRTSLSQCNPKANSPELSVGLFKEGEEVWVSFDKMPPVQGRVVRQLGPTRFSVNIAGVLKHCHVNQMVKSV